MIEENFREVYGWVTGEDAVAKKEGEAVAKVAAERIERSKKKLELTMPGTMNVVAGAVINLTGFRPQVNGRYKIVVVQHAVGRAGWITNLTCEGAA